ncbi:hypothetical protein EUX98_g4834 [Antrodiella citrinella]|uniref:Uncharacterized protein n=1 Tax=Antrodiella citrinella TaxID=2447956 RepID=A0A4S4MVS6_9APHY|nr:hypothetical protein EUX98_g4834 [Antrodiella citrinella]
MITDNTQKLKVPFFAGNAFTTGPYGGNPAVVVFLQDELPDEILLGIANNFNQSVITFVYPPTPEDTEVNGQTASFRIRWFSTLREIWLCGHGSFVAAASIFDTPGLVSAGVQSLRLKGKHNTLTARRVDDGQIELTLGAKDVERVTPAQEKEIGDIVKRSIGDIQILSVWTDKKFVLVEVEEKGEGDLASRKVDTDTLIETGYPSNIITAGSSDPDVAFISRVFHPAQGLAEDPVCGSAHGLLTPYWSKKQGFGDKQVSVKQVSPRGGGLDVKWNIQEGTVTLRVGLSFTAVLDWHAGRIRWLRYPNCPPYQHFW